MAARITGFLAIAALAIAACAAPPGPHGSEALGVRVNRVAVAPLNLAIRVPEVLAGKGEPVWDELLRRFQVLDKQVSVVSLARAELLWLEATADLDLSDRRAALRTAHSRFARGLAEHRDYDLLIMPSLVLRRARLRSGVASWDGVRRVLHGSTLAFDPGVSDAFRTPTNVTTGGLEGKVGAASLHVVVLRPDGTEQYQGLGGLDLMQKAQRAKTWERRWTYEERSDPFANAENLREGVERALQAMPRRTARSG